MKDAAQKLKKLLDLLDRHPWRHNHDLNKTYCRYCGNRKENGHASHCGYSKLMDKINNDL